MPEPFEALRETLLRAGVAPGRVRRYMHELGDHLSDLVGDEMRAGKNQAEAETAARMRLGADDALADAMMAERSLRSWTGRAPWATLLIAPIGMLVLAWVLPLRGLALLLGHPGMHSQPAPPSWLPPAGDAVFGVIQIAAPLLIVAGAALLAVRQRSRMVWPVLGCLAVAYLGGGFVWSAHWPASGARGLFMIGFRWEHSLVVGSLSLAVAAAIYRRTLGRGLAGA